MELVLVTLCLLVVVLASLLILPARAARCALPPLAVRGPPHTRARAGHAFLSWERCDGVHRDRAGAVTRGIETAETAPPATASVFKQPFSPQSGECWSCRALGGECCVW